VAQVFPTGILNLLFTGCVGEVGAVVLGTHCKTVSSDARSMDLDVLRRCGASLASQCHRYLLVLSSVPAKMQRGVACHVFEGSCVPHCLCSSCCALVPGALQGQLYREKAAAEAGNGKSTGSRPAVSLVLGAGGVPPLVQQASVTPSTAVMGLLLRRNMIPTPRNTSAGTGVCLACR
jgi:hypothetical protein